MKCSINRTIKALRATGSVFGHLLTALLGTAIIESEFWHILPSSVVFEGSCFKEYFFSTLIPFGLGYFVFWKWRTRSAQWVCIAWSPLVWTTSGSLLD
jgi:hypothetical protein